MLVVLRRLCAEPRHGFPLSSREIARRCGFDHKHIDNIERRALRRLRALVPPEMRAELASMLSRSRVRATARNTSNSPTA